jgi:hypothetical protein
LKEKLLALLKQIEKTCHVLLEDRQLLENRLIAVKLGIQQILTLCGSAMREMEKDPKEEK